MLGLLKNKKKDMNEIQDEIKKVSPGQLQFQKELPELYIIPQCKLTQDKNDIMNFKVTYTPEKDSLWYGGKYEFSISVAENYPFNPPKVVCNTKIYHPNIDLKGNVCLNILKDDWKPTLNLSTVIAGIYFLFTDPNPNDPLNHDAATVMRDNPDQFVLNIKKSLRGGYLFGEEFPRFT
jgi:ubiquitin-conjugating enzyme E2 M